MALVSIVIVETDVSPNTQWFYVWLTLFLVTKVALSGYLS